MLSRVADQLYWLSRYLERAEHTARMLQVSLDFFLDRSEDGARHRIGLLLASLQVRDPALVSRGANGVLETLAIDAQHPASVLTCLSLARENARQVREQISSEMWEQLNSLYLQVTEPGSTWRWRHQPHAFLRVLSNGVHLFRGLSDSTIRRAEGWDFLGLGRDLERVINTATLLGAHWELLLGPEGDPRAVPQDSLEWVGLLKTCLAFETYCELYSPTPRPDRVLELLLLDPAHPHAIRYAINQIQQALEEIARTTRSSDSPLERLAGRLHATLTFAQVEEVLRQGVPSFLQQIVRGCNEIDRAIHNVYIAYPVEAALLR